MTRVIMTVYHFKDIILYICIHLRTTVHIPVKTTIVLAYIGERVSSVVEHSSSNPKVPGLILGPVSYRGHGL